MSHIKLLEWECIFSAIVSWKYVTFFFFYRGSYLRVSLTLREDFVFGILNNGTTRTLGTLEDGLNTFCVMRWP
jgi:hypothetical protein